MPAVAPFCIDYPTSLSTLNRKKVNMPGILLQIIKMSEKLLSGTGGTSKGHPTARKKVRSADFEAF
jgi:hypothetical protein